MAGGSWCTEVEREVIYHLKSLGTSITMIANKLRCSRTKVYNALNHVKESGNFKNAERKPSVRKTTSREDNLIRRMSIKNPSMTSAMIQRGLSVQYDINVSARTIRYRRAEFKQQEISKEKGAKSRISKSKHKGRRTK